MPAGLMLRNRLAMDVMSRRQGGRASAATRSPQSGPVVATLAARAVEPPAGSVGGPHRAPRRRRAAGPDAGLRSQRRSAVRRRSAVQRLLGRSRAAHRLRLVHAGQRRAASRRTRIKQTNSCGYGCHAWVIDAHPEDMKQARLREAGRRARDADDRRLPAAERRAVPRRPALGQPVRVEGRAEPPALLRDRSPRRRPGRALLRRRRPIARWRGPQARGVAAQAPARRGGECAGAARLQRHRHQQRRGAGPIAGRTRRAPATAFASDIYRVSVIVEGAGWEADVQNALVAVAAGQSARVPSSRAREPARLPARGSPSPSCRKAIRRSASRP